MGTIVIDIPPEIYKQLEEQARSTGKALEVFSRELLQKAVRARQESQHPYSTAREVLQASARIRPLSQVLRRKIIPSVTLDEVRTALTQAGGPSLSEIILEQRGSKL